jgi:hypothetical protein
VEVAHPSAHSPSYWAKTREDCTHSCLSRKRRICLLTALLLALGTFSYVANSLMQLQAQGASGTVGTIGAQEGQKGQGGRGGATASGGPVVNAASAIKARVFTVSFKNRGASGNGTDTLSVASSYLASGWTDLRRGGNVTETVTIASGWAMDLQVPGGKGTTLAWEWELDQKDIGFSVSLLALPLASAASPLQLADANAPEEVVPVRKHFAGERVVGSYEYPRSGVLSLVWNNEYSWVCVFSRAFTRTCTCTCTCTYTCTCTWTCTCTCTCMHSQRMLV